MLFPIQYGTQNSAVGTATSYGLDGPGIEKFPVDGEIFITCPDQI
jgi:hypothetical protein